MNMQTTVAVTPFLAQTSHPSVRSDAPEPKSAFEKQAFNKAKEFESVFLAMFVEQMSTGTEPDAPFGGGSAEKVYKSMMSQQYAKSIAGSGGIGIADQVYSEILKAQEAGTP